MAQEVQLPSAQLDDTTEDLGDATQGTILSVNTEPFVLVDLDTLSVDVDAGGVVVVTFNTVDFVDITAATGAEVIAAINAALTGATAVVEAGAIRITSDAFGAASSIEVTAEPAGTPFAFPSGVQSGVDAADVTQLINRIPEPGETGVPIESDVQVEIHDTAGAPASTGVEIEIEGVLAFDGDAGGFQTGFSGTVSNPDANTLRISIDPDVDFADDTVIDMDVEVVGGSTALDVQYTFTTEDLTPPSVTAAQAREKKIVRVTYSEAVQQVSPTASDDALNPANYVLVTANVPAVSAAAVEVTSVSPTEVDVEVDIELSFDATYVITATNVEDLFGNVIAPPNNAASFVAFRPPQPVDRRFELIEFLPQINRSEDTTRELATYIAIKQDVTNLLLCEIDRFAEILDPDFAPEPFLTCMLDDLGNPFDFVDLTEIDKRRLIRVLVDIYKQKGTEIGIINVINFLLGVLVTIDVFNGEGWELASSSSPTLDGQSPPAGPGDELPAAGETEPADVASLGPGTLFDLYSFVVISPVNLTAVQRDRITQIVDLMKPAHTHLVRIDEPATSPAPLGGDELGGGELSGATVGIPPWTLS